MGYEKLLDPLNDLRDSCEVLLGGLFGRLTGDARESVKAIHAGTGGLYALFVDIITALGIENTARRAFLQDKFRKLLRLVIDNSRALLAEMDGPLNEEQQVSVTFIYETGVRLQQYVESIWLYSRLHLNQIKARVEPLALPQLKTALRPPPVERTLQTIFFVDQGLPPVHSDPRLLRRCVQELLDNAAKFSTRDLVIIHCQPAASGPG
ncbi:MAG: hypothetical protein MUE40_17340, partial [Anaerolineae bacterium]|nr:hypothetical protein [Anaerolineae bacterium]